MIQVSINGTATTIENNATLDQLLHRVGITSDSTGVAVALNETVVPREKWNRTAPQPGDRVEIIHAVQGG